jgi:hypothetical protein
VFFVQISTNPILPKRPYAIPPPSPFLFPFLQPFKPSVLKNEKLTRKEIIDKFLKQADWNVTGWTQVVEEFDIHLTVVEDPATPYVKRNGF